MFKVVHTCLDLSAATTELPLLCSGDVSVETSSGLGSNVGLPVNERRVPKVIFFGGGIPEEEYERVTTLVRASAGHDSVSFLRVTREDVLAAGASGPDPDVIAKIYRDKIAAL
jgi:hypothetical protein